MYCIKCGSEIVVGAEFCAQCGTKIAKEEKKNKILDEPIVEKGTTKRKKSKGLLIGFLLINFAVLSFGVVNLLDLYDYYLFRITETDELFQIIDNNSSMQSDEAGMSIQGIIQSPAGGITYDTIYDDDTTQDGYKDRRSYYLESDLLFASWDENMDGIYELSMKVSEGLYVETAYADVDHDGNIDEIVQYNQVGETTSVNIPEGTGNEMSPLPIRFIEIMKIYDILLIVIPIILILVFSVLLWKYSKKSRVGEKFICFLLTVSLLGFTNITNVYSSEGLSNTNSSELYNEDGTVNQSIFERDWLKYSDIDDRIPIETRSYEARSYSETEQKVANIYNQMYDIVTKQELNRIEYVEITNYKKNIVHTHKSNLIKSFFRLSAFTAYTIKDATDTGKSFAENILKSSATVMSSIDNVFEVTSNYVTDDYEDEFGNVNTVFSYGTSDNVLDTFKDDLKGRVKEKIEETLDSANLYVTVDDLKLSDDDIALLKNHHQKNRDLDNYILENRNINKQFDTKLEQLNNQIAEELGNMEAFRQQEKERVYYVLSQNPPIDGEETIEVFDNEDWILLEEYEDEWDDVDWISEEGEVFAEAYEIIAPSTDRLVGKWQGIFRVKDLDFSTTHTMTESDWDFINQFKENTKENTGDVSVEIYKSGEVYRFKYGELDMKLYEEKNALLIERGFIDQSINEGSLSVVADITGTTNDEGTYMKLYTIFRVDIIFEGESIDMDLDVEMELYKE